MKQKKLIPLLVLSTVCLAMDRDGEGNYEGSQPRSTASNSGPVLDGSAVIDAGIEDPPADEKVGDDSAEDTNRPKTPGRQSAASSNSGPVLNGSAVIDAGIEDPPADHEAELVGGGSAEDVDRPETPVYSVDINVSIPVESDGIKGQRFEAVTVRVAPDTTVGQLEGMLTQGAENVSPISLILNKTVLADKGQTLDDVFGRDQIEKNIGQIIGTFEKNRTNRFFPDNLPKDLPAEPATTAERMQQVVDGLSLAAQTGREWAAHYGWVAKSNSGPTSREV